MAQRKICKHCWFWSRCTPTQYRHKANEEIEQKFGACSNNRFEYVGNKELTTGVLFAYWDYESVEADFKTHEDFGCVLFSPTDAKRKKGADDGTGDARNQE